MMQTADSVSRFFSNLPKRQLALEKWIGELLHSGLKIGVM